MMNSGPAVRLIHPAVKQGDRIAQLVLEKIVMAPILEVEVGVPAYIPLSVTDIVQDLDATARGEGGFGSTGGFGR